MTGATGFIGGRMLAHLLAEGERVVALTRPDSPRNVLLPPEVEARPVQLLDQDGLTRALAGCEVVAHLAAPGRSARRNGDPGRRPGGAEVLVTGTERLVRAAGAAGLRRVILASSTGVYGRPWHSVDEDSATDPRTPYQRNRLEGERVATETAAAQGMELVVARVSEVWGPGGGGQGSLVRAVASGRFRLIGDGDVAHQMAYVDDVAAALELCGRVPVTGVRRYLISGPPATFADFVHALARAAGSRVGTAPALGPPARAVLAGLSRARLAPALANVLDYHLRPRAYDLRRSRAELGPYHHTNADAGVRATLDWHLGDERRG